MSTIAANPHVADLFKQGGQMRDPSITGDISKRLAVAYKHDTGREFPLCDGEGGCASSPEAMAHYDAWYLLQQDAAK